MNVLIADKFESQGIDTLKAIGCEVNFAPDLADDALAAALAGSPSAPAPQVLVVRSTKVAASTIQAASALKLIVRAGSGFNTIDIDAARSAGIGVANCPGMNATAVAELALGLMLAIDRRIVDNVNDLRQGVWNKKEYSKALGLKGRTLGVVGLGRIGHLIAQRAHALQMKLVYTDVVPNPTAEKELGITRIAMDELFRTADFITLHVPANDETKHLINDTRLALMKPTAVLINCSRGEVVDGAALARALDSGRLRGAGLDVFENEPGASDKSFTDPVAGCTRVYGTHHIGASTDQAQLAVAEETVRIIEHFKKTGEILNCVNT